MKKSLLGLIASLLLVLCGCEQKKTSPVSDFEVPSFNHDLGYIPLDKKVDDLDYVVCDSTVIRSGRNRLRYIDGNAKFRKDVTTSFISKSEYDSFNGYVVVRFMFNCENKAGRYRAQALNLDFSKANAPSGLLDSTIDLIKSLNNWKKAAGVDPKTEYSKFINLKFENGKITHVLL